MPCGNLEADCSRMRKQQLHTETGVHCLVFWGYNEIAIMYGLYEEQSSRREVREL